jgi:large subunit ribosomal protein L15
MARLQLHNIKPAKGSISNKKRIGRGWGSRGKYCGRGAKGQKARSGSHGHQLRGLRSVMLATPKVRGFNSRLPKSIVVSLDVINKTFIEGELVTPKTLLKKKLISNATQCVKILAGGALSKKLVFKHCIVSKQAGEKIKALGGVVE